MKLFIKTFLGGAVGFTIVCAVMFVPVLHASAADTQTEQKIQMLFKEVVQLQTQLSALLAYTSNVQTSFKIGDTVETTDFLKVRKAAGTRAKKIGVQNPGAVGEITSGPVSSSGYVWWYVDFQDSTIDGWVAEDWLGIVVSPEATADATLSLQMTNTATELVDRQGVFTLSFSVTAEGNDVLIPSSVARVTAVNQDYVATDPSVGFWYGIYNAADPGSHAGQFSTSIDTAAVKVGDSYKVAKGTTENFELTVNYNPDQSGEYRVTLMATVFNEDHVLELSPAWDYRTDLLAIELGTLVLDVDYEDGVLEPLTQGVTVTAPTVAAAQVTSDIVRDGSYAIRYELHDTDPLVDGGTRTESHAINCANCRYETGDTVYYGFSVYIPPNWINDDVNSDILFQWHTPTDYSLGEAGKNPNMFFAMKRNDFVLRITHDPNLVTTATSAIKEQVNLVTNVESGWHDFVFKVHWSYNDDGEVTVWHKQNDDENYAEVLAKQGANMQNDLNPGFIKWGIYKPSWNGESTTNVSERIVYHDNIKIGGTFEEVQR